LSASHGLSEATVAKIHEVFGRHPEVEKAVVYGSRAKGNFKPGSDIDLTLSGERLDLKILGQLESELDDLLLPYEFDLSIFSKLTHPDLVEHIKRVGVVFYERPTAPRVS
jgi:predicted nucleotidyltransferase